MNGESPFGEDEMSDYEMYGTTPPRTRRRNREKKQHAKDTAG